MTDPVPADDATLFPKSVGERLREAREAQGLSLAEIAARTRVPLRQLEAIELDNYSGLPSVTYAVGFAKAYARAVGADEVSIARDVRATSDQTVQRTNYEAYEIDDPKRLPSGGVLIVSLIAVALLLIAVGLWYGSSLFGGDDSATAAATVTANEIAPQAPVEQKIVPVPATGQVVLTATDEVWMRVYDATGKTLFQNTLKPGERYEVPSDANGPMINVGRPDKLQVTVNGSAVPALGDGRLAIKDVGISAAALTGRTGGPAPTPSTAAPATEVPSPGSSATVPPAFRTTAARPAVERRDVRPVQTRLPDAPTAVTPPSGDAAPVPASSPAPTP